MVSLNQSLANKAEASDLTTLQNTLANNYYTKNPQNLPSGFNSTDRASMNHLKNGWYWHFSDDGALNFPSDWGFMIKFGFENDGDFSALYFVQDRGAIYRCSGNAYVIHHGLQFHCRFLIPHSAIAELIILIISVS